MSLKEEETEAPFFLEDALAQSENVDLVDEDDIVIGVGELSECLLHGLLHRAVMVFLLNSRTQIFLQRRSRRDRWYPGYWTASCSGHVKSKETYQSAAIRELKEELSLNSNPVELFKFLMPKLKYREFTEWEYMCVFETHSDEKIIPNPDEIEEGKFVTVQEFKKMTSDDPSSFTPDLVLAFERYAKLKEPFSGKKRF